MLLLILIFLTLSSTFQDSKLLCCYYSEHYHNCYESIKEEGCIIGPSIFPEKLYNQPYYVVCSKEDCPPSELGGIFLRGFKKKCPECV